MSFRIKEEIMLENAQEHQEQEREKVNLKHEREATKISLLHNSK